MIGNEGRNTPNGKKQIGLGKLAWKFIIQVSWRLSKISVSAQKKHVSATECTGSGLKEVHKSKGAIYKITEKMTKSQIGIAMGSEQSVQIQPK